MAQSARQSGALNEVGQAVNMDVDGFSSLGFQVSGVFTGTVTFKGSVDGVNFGDLAVSTLANGAIFVTTATAVGVWRAAVALRAVRAICTAYTDGLITATIIAS